MKQLVAGSLSVLGGSGAVIITSLALWTEILVPRVIGEAREISREEADRAIAAHVAGGPHIGAARQADIDRLEKRFDNVATKEGLELIVQRLDAMDARLARLEDRQ